MYRACHCADNAQHGGGGRAGGPHRHHGQGPPALHRLLHPPQAPLWLRLPGMPPSPAALHPCMASSRHKFPPTEAMLTFIHARAWLSAAHDGILHMTVRHNQLFRLQLLSAWPWASVMCPPLCSQTALCGYSHWLAVAPHHLSQCERS